jgi:LL-diaminopimelate aminotransferase
VDFAAKHGIVIVHDAAYGAIRYDGQNPLSIMAIDGAMDVAVEVHSLSKAFNMTGWRLGFIVGGREMISAYANVKDNVDSGQFRAIQLAGAYALNHPELTAANCERYARRIRLLTQTLREVGFDAREPRATFYLYVKSPTGARSAGRFSSADEAGSYILEHASICTVPWDDAGGYLRMSVTFPAESPEDELALMAEIKARLNSLELGFD